MAPQDDVGSFASNTTNISTFNGGFGIEQCRGPAASHLTTHTCSLDEGDGTDHNDSEFDERTNSQSSETSFDAPPRPDDVTRTLKHTDMKTFGNELQMAARIAFPCGNRSRYSDVYVLMFSWESEDWKLPVSEEIAALRKVFEEIYHYNVEEFKIPDHRSHNKADDLKIVYYAGHARLSKTKEVVWARASETNEKCSTVTWTGIQADLQQAQSDALILLDCCYAGVVDGGEGNGVTELLAACSFNSEANGVGHYSFTTALTIELQIISKRKSFTIGELYANLYRRSQSYMARGVPNERYPPPAHVLLRTDEKLYRCIQLSAYRNSYMDASTEKHGTCESQTSSSKPIGQKWPLVTEALISSSTQHPCLSTNCKPPVLDIGSSDSFTPKPAEGHTIVPDNASMSNESRSHCQDGAGDSRQCSFKATQGPSSIPHWPIEKDSAWPSDAPRMLLAVRFTEDISQKDLRPDLFVDWLRAMPANIAEVTCVEAGFKCDSTLLLISLPISMWTYLSKDPAHIPMGRVMSSNLVMGRLRNADGIGRRVGGPLSEPNVETKMEDHCGQDSSCLARDSRHGKLLRDANRTEVENCRRSQNVADYHIPTVLQAGGLRAESVSFNQKESIPIEEIRPDGVAHTYHASQADLQGNISSQPVRGESRTSKNSESVLRATQNPENCHQSELVDCAMPRLATRTGPSETTRGSSDVPDVTSYEVCGGFHTPTSSPPQERFSTLDRTSFLSRMRQNHLHTSSQQNNHPGVAVTEGQPSFNLQPYTETIWETTRGIVAIQKQFEKLSELYTKHAKDIENVTEVHLKLSKSRNECNYKDAKIRQQKNTITELITLRKEEETNLAKIRDRLNEDKKRLWEEKEEQDRRTKKVEKFMEARRAEMKLEMEKMLADRMREQEKEVRAREDQRKKELCNLQAENKKLSKDLEMKEKRIEELTRQLKAMKDDFDDIKTVKTVYKEEKENLEAKLHEVQNEFGLTSKTPDFYKGKFADIASTVEKISLEYFSALPTNDFEKIHEELIAIDKCFESIPIANDNISENLRIAHAQRIISSALYTYIWQPFSSDKALSNPKFATLLDEIYTRLANNNYGGKNGYAAVVWKVLGMRVLQSQDQDLQLNPISTSHEASHYLSRASQAVQDILKKLSPLIAPAEKVQTQEALLRLAQAAVYVWNFAETDKLKIEVCLSLNSFDRNIWRSIRFDPILSMEDASSEMDIKLFTHPRVFTLFPQVFAQSLSLTAEPAPHILGSFSTPQQEFSITKIRIHPGIGLPEWSALVVRGKVEEEENKAFQREVMENARKLARTGRNRKSSRSASVSGSMSGPRSPSARWGTNGAKVKGLESED
ncbi:uncharacterized protein PAC_08700 [Phialocephala subalpina]|uniref:Uncharacterized protein n=1 Tax=Phialocephala subalpina TaxID=576137 RepID=A0A1L7X1B2_9HELO|nr:uncharacterized protein PAC_08700 [Phialocephala subalpina]